MWDQGQEVKQEGKERKIKKRSQSVFDDQKGR